MIMQILLVYIGPLCERDWHKEATDPVVSPESRGLAPCVRQVKEQEISTYNLHPALLATCQKLFEEGQPLLYGCNTIGLQFCGAGVMLYADSEISAHTRDDRGRYITLTDERFSKLLARFDKVHIDIYCSPDEELALKTVVLGMAGTLQGKVLQVIFDPDDQVFSKFTDYDVPACMEAQLRFFKLIRCQELWVLNTTLDPSRVSDIAEVATGTEPVVNLWPSLYDFEDYYSALNTICDHSGYQELYYTWNDNDEWMDMEDAALECDAAKFCKARSRWMEQIDVDYKRCTKIAFQNDSAMGRHELQVNKDMKGGSVVESSMDEEGRFPASEYAPTRVADKVLGASAS